MTESSIHVRLSALVYRVRFPAALLALGLSVAAFVLGFGRVEQFSAQVAALSDRPVQAPQPQVFDPRSDVWFDPEDSALAAFHDLEDRFVGEDILFVAFEDRESPFGVFGPKALNKVAELTRQIEQIPYVRNVRSLTANPWIRWGEVAPGEQGLLVSDLFEDEPAAYDEAATIERMVAVLGAERSAALIGEDKVRQHLGQEADFADFMGEPRLLRGLLSEDGRSTAVQVQVLRPRPDADRLDAVFGVGDSLPRTVGPVIHKSVKHNQVVEAIERLTQDDPDYTMHLAGTPVLERHFQQVGKSDMRYVGLMFGVIGIALLLIYRRVSGALIPLLTVISTILGMVGSVWLSGNLLNNLTAVTPTVVTAVGIADAVHLVSAYFLLRPEYSDRRALVIEVLSRNLLPVFLTSLTTAVGFLSLSSSAIIPVHEFGITAGLGTAIAYLISMTVVPALLSLLPLPKTRPAGQQASSVEPTGRTDRWVDFVLSHRPQLLLSTALLFGFAGVGMTQVEFATDLRLMFADGDPVRSDIYWWDANMGGVGDLELLFFGPEATESEEAAQARNAEVERLSTRQLQAGGLSPAEAQRLTHLQAASEHEQRQRIATSSQFLSRLDAFQQRLEQEAALPGSPLRTLARFDSALDVLRKMHQVQNENRAEAYRVPVLADIPQSARVPSVAYDDVLEESLFIPGQTADSLIAQYYLQYENGARPSENLANLITADRRGFRMTVRLGTAPSAQTIAAFDRVREIARDEFPELASSAAQVQAGKALSTMTMTGRQFMFTNMFRRFSDTMVQSLGFALLTITALIMVVFRSPTLGLISIVPNVLPILLPLAVLGYLGVQIDGPSVVVASVALGVCVDDTIHLFSKFNHFRAQGLAADAALKAAFRHIGGALTFTTVALVLGFSVLTLGSFRPNIVTGYLGATMIALAFVADFLLTPALLSLMHARSGDLPASAATQAEPAAE